MTWSRQDFVTFAIGWLAALGVEVGLILKDVDVDSFDIGRLGISLAVASISSTGRYLVTQLAQKAVT